MINPVLERRLADCTELIEAWRGFLNLFNLMMNTQGDLPPDAELQFMQCKARIAMLHDSFQASLKHDQNIAQNMLAIVNRSITLRHLRKLGAADKKKMEIEWHECYLLLNETVSQVAEEREKLANVNEFNYKMGKQMEGLKVTVKAFVRSIWFKLILFFAILLGVIFGVPGEYWDKLRKVNVVGKPYGAYLDFKREVMRLGGPYSTVEKFKSQRFVPDVPKGYAYSEHVGATADSQAPAYDWVKLYDGSSGSVLLMAPEGYVGMNITTSENREVVMTAFYWFTDQQARDFESGWSASLSNVPPRFNLANYTMFRDNNVIVILWSTNEADRNLVKSQVFKK